MSIGNVNNNSLKSLFFPVLMMIVSSFYMPLFLYLSNAEEAYFYDIFKFCLIFFSVTLIIFAGFFIYKRNIVKASFNASIIVFILSNFKIFEYVIKLLPIHLRYWHVLAIVLFIIVHILYIIYKFSSDSTIRSIQLVLTLVLSGLIVFNFILAVPNIIKKVNVVNTEPDNVQNINYSNEKLPNIYYFIFDEFSANDVVQKYYDYDNSAFYNKLEDLGFTVSENSENKSFETITVTANYMNYDYVVTDEDPSNKRLEVRKNNRTKNLMSELGYDINGFSVGNHLDYFGMVNDSNNGNNLSAITVEGSSINDLIIENTVLYPLLSDDKTQLATEINEVFDYFEDKNNFNQNDQTYNFIYLPTPHEPFLFNADGTMTNPKNYYNWEDKQFYLNQYIYVTNKISTMVEKIVEYDPESVIILQSDHSARYMSGIANEDKVHIFNAVYYMGQPLDEIKGKSGVNTLRTIYSKLFNLDLPDLEVVE